MAAFQPIQPPTTEVPPLKDSEHIKDTIVAVEEQPEQGAAAVEVAKYDDEEVPSLKQEDAPVSLQPTEVGQIFRTIFEAVLNLYDNQVEVTKVPVPEVHGAVLETPSFEVGNLAVEFHVAWLTVFLSGPYYGPRDQGNTLSSFLHPAVTLTYFMYV